MKHSAKRVEIVTLKMVKKSSFLYASRIVRSPSEVVTIFHDFLGIPDREHFVVICLDVKNHPTDRKSVV